MPVTKSLMRCMNWKRKDIRDQAGTGSIVDSSNADLTHALVHRALGQQDVCKEFKDPAKILEHYGMIEHFELPERESENE